MAQQKIKVHHNTVKKYLTKMGVLSKAKKSAPKTTARQKSIIKARLKLLTQNFFFAKSIYKWQQQKYYESEDYSATEDVNIIMAGCH
jgi:hypothetical protein